MSQSHCSNWGGEIAYQAAITRASENEMQCPECRGTGDALAPCELWNGGRCDEDGCEQFHVCNGLWKTKCLTCEGEGIVDAETYNGE